MLHLGKDIENRPRNIGMPTGLILMHAAKGMTAKEYADACRWMRDRALGDTHPSDRDAGRPLIPDPSELPRGGIVGCFRIATKPMLGPHEMGPPWKMGAQWGIPITDVRPLPFVPWKGMLGFWRVPPELIAAINAKLAAEGKPGLEE